jgi:hypothetical protein
MKRHLPLSPSRRRAILQALDQASDREATGAIVSGALTEVAPLPAQIDTGLQTAGGCRSARWAKKLVCDVLVLQTAGEATRSIEPRAKEIIEGLHELEPRDAVDGMLGVLMISCYQQAMESLTIARERGQEKYVSNYYSQSSTRVVNLSQAGQLMRTFAQLTETRDRRRKNSEAGPNVTVIVERGANG